VKEYYEYNTKEGVKFCFHLNKNKAARFSLQMKAKMEVEYCIEIPNLNIKKKMESKKNYDVEIAYFNIKQSEVEKLIGESKLSIHISPLSVIVKKDLSLYKPAMQLIHKSNTSCFQQNSFQKKVKESIERRFCGLKNPGDYCFMNCIIQILFYIPVIRKVVSDEMKDHPLRKLFNDMEKNESATISDLVKIDDLGYRHKQDDALGFFLHVLSYFPGMKSFFLSIIERYQINGGQSILLQNDECFTFQLTGSLIGSNGSINLNSDDDAIVKSKVTKLADIVVFDGIRQDYIWGYQQNGIGLDLIPKTIQINCVNYSLHSIIARSGIDSHSGHYKSYIYTDGGPECFCFNDSYIERSYAIDMNFYPRGFVYIEQTKFSEMFKLGTNSKPKTNDHETHKSIRIISEFNAQQACYLFYESLFYLVESDPLYVTIIGNNINELFTLISKLFDFKEIYSYTGDFKKPLVKIDAHSRIDDINAVFVMENKSLAEGNGVCGFLRLYDKYMNRKLIGPIKIDKNNYRDRIAELLPLEKSIKISHPDSFYDGIVISIECDVVENGYIDNNMPIVRVPPKIGSWDNSIFRVHLANDFYLNNEGHYVSVPKDISLSDLIQFCEKDVFHLIDSYPDIGFLQKDNGEFIPVHKVDFSREYVLFTLAKEVNANNKAILVNVRTIDNTVKEFIKLEKSGLAMEQYLVTKGLMKDGQIFSTKKIGNRVYITIEK